MKALKPSHREHKRYLLVSGKDVSRKSLEDAVLRFVGILGYAEACPEVIKEKEGKVVLMINRGALDKIRASFTLSGKDIRVEKVSGMINNL